MKALPPAGDFSIGLTGGIGSGKSAVAQRFAARGAAIIDTDQIAHALTAADGKAIPAIRAHFGSSFLTADGAMDRAQMRAHVFSNPSAKLALELILHPLIRNEALQAGGRVHDTYPIFVIPLLVESSGWRSILSRILVVDCPEALQVKRVKTRSGLSEMEISAIMANQVSREKRLSAADDIIVNDGDLKSLEPQIDELHRLYSTLYRANKTKGS